MANCTIAARCCAVTAGVCLCGGTAAGMTRICVQCRVSSTVCASTKCPLWMGLKVPPKMPMISILEILSKRGGNAQIESIGHHHYA